MLLKSSAAAPQLTMIYFPVRALAEPARMILEFGGVAYEDASPQQAYGVPWKDAKDKTPFGAGPGWRDHPRGGAYVIGCASNYDGASMAERAAALGNPVVVVTLDYRLGAFGFLGGTAMRARDPDRSTGNYGIQDQRAAIKWVRANAAVFGGDVGSVTIFGQSAGAGSIANHYVQPDSRGLFDRAIAESGAFSRWNAMPRAIGQGQYDYLATELGCDLKSDPVACLLAKPWKDVQAAATRAVPPSWFGLQWAPVVDGVALPVAPYFAIDANRSAEAVAADALDALDDEANDDEDEDASVVVEEAGGARAAARAAAVVAAPPVVEVADVPLLLGSCLFPNKPKADDSGLRECCGDNVAHTLSTQGYDRWVDGSFWTQWIRFGVFDAVHAAQARRAYLDVASSQSPWWAARALAAGLQMFSRRGGRVRLPYRFDYAAYAGTNPYVGVAHSAELPFVFAADEARATPQLAALSDAIVRYWTNFAASADPNPLPPNATSRGGGRSRGTVEATLPSLPSWPAYDAATQRQIVLNATDLRVEDGWNAAHCEASAA
ncbi:hypothetical protein EMIHUDRAFT_193920 [Emiliania huxleyi CCMP1516]|uniref:Carboxylic ester hydrolase n=2 Tax=Emiliania huxleyi TaxID=2903 RepID=A0A0D3L0M7_EMIH1|nr:hypothetical protein EMIHUDRAFT_193920 [Emiliania huxleyi CCMP1516]EOD41562.1 hypothetical protein EMIHUDRAFT_193920 [Emiliania huxleyi CCMP1516]|eukprot:XP_005793991.1 hypothetical protein EMIHUDRAFT_193920 [Emiliania huxleyi CCMP1516]